MLFEEPPVRLYNPEFLRQARKNNRKRQMLREQTQRQARIEMLAEEAAKARKEILAKKAATKADAEAERRLRVAGELSTPAGSRVEKIEFRAMRAFQVTRAELRGSGQNKQVSFARQFVMYWARRLCQLSYKQIANRLGRADHTSVHHGVRAYVEKRKGMGRTLRAAR